jgi:hypothetical protein
MRKRTIEPNGKHQAFKMDVDALLIKHGATLAADEILALCAQVVGMVIAFQDRDTMSADRALAIVMANIEGGNAQGLASLANPFKLNG